MPFSGTGSWVTGVTGQKMWPIVSSVGERGETTLQLKAHNHSTIKCLMFELCYLIQGGPKMAQFVWYSLKKLFHCQNQEKMCNNTITKDPTTPEVCRYTTLWAAQASHLRVVRTGPVCCEPRHRRVEASSVGLCRRWRRTFWTLLMIATLK